MKKSMRKLLIAVALLLVAIFALAACDEVGGGKLSVKYDDSHVFTEGDDLEIVKNYLTVTYTDADGVTTKITDFELSGKLSKGESKLTVTYKGVTTTVTVKVSEIPVGDIQIRFDEGCVIHEYDELEKVKHYLTVTYTNAEGVVTEITDYTLSGTLTAGECELTVSYNGITATVTVHVEGKSNEHISAVFNGADVVICEGDDLEMVRSYLSVTYTDAEGKTQEIYDYELSGTLTQGECELIVRYKGVTATVTVHVAGKSNEHILAVFNGADVVICEGDDLEKVRSFLVVTLTDAEGKTQEIYDYELSGTLTRGECELTVVYNGITAKVVVPVSCNHVFPEWKVIESATCANPGLCIGVCTLCGYKEEQQLPQLPHNSTHIEAHTATCEAEGNVEYWYCSACETYFGDEDCTKELSSDAVTLPKAHVFGAWVEKVSATCTNTGRKGYQYCSVCQKNYDADGNEIEDLVIAALGHDATDWIEDYPANCTQEGARHKECSVCHETLETETIPFAHQFGEWIDEVPASCTDGTKGHYECSLCHGNFDANGEPINDLTINAQHDIFVVHAQEPTCTESGWKTYEKCLLCDYTTYVEIPALGHKLSYVEAKATNCQEEGNVEHWHCSTCKKNFNDAKGENELTNVTIAKEHLLGNWIDEVPTTCTENGTKGHYECSVCNGYFDVDHNRIYNWTIYTSGHNYKNGVCDICGQEQSEGLQYELSSDETYYIVSGMGTCTANDIVIPSVHGNLPVKAIGDNAFSNCNQLLTITIPNSVISIGVKAFEYSNLRIIEIPNSVTSIGEDAFKSYMLISEVHITDIAAWCNIEFGNGYSNPLYNAYAPKLYLNGELVTVLEIPSTVTEIKDYAFCGGYEFTSVNIPTNVTSIGKRAFDGCSKLTSIEIPTSVTSVGDSAFMSCYGLTAVYITDLAAWCNIDFADVYANPLENAENLYLNGELVTNLEIPSTVTEIKDYAFYGGSFKSIVIADSVKSIGNYAFSGCRSLTSTTFEENSQLKSIGSDAFHGCSSLTSIEIPASVTLIGSYVFAYCSNLASITFDGSSQLKSIGQQAFYYCYGLEGVYLTDLAAWCNIEFESNFSDLTHLEANPLYFAHNLYVNGQLVTELEIPSTVTSISSYAFSGCSCLTSVSIPNTITSIGYSAFNGCSSLEKITIPFVGAKAGVTNDDTYQYPFGYIFGTEYYIDCVNITQKYYGSSLTEQTSSKYALPASLTSVVVLGENILCGAFYGCTNLTSVTVSDAVTSIGKGAFYGCSSLEEMTIPFVGASKDDKENTSFGYIFSNAVPYSLEKLTITSATSIADSAFPLGTRLTSITIPSSVTSIGTSAFGGCNRLAAVHITDLAAWCNVGFGNHSSNPLCSAHNLYLNGELVTELEIPSTVTEIKPYAFAGGSFTNVVMLSNVTSIDSYAFYRSSLTSIVIPSSVISIGSYAFDESSLESVTFAENSQMKSIGSSAFYGCSSLTSIVIPSSVTSIGRYAFYNCSSLTSITIPTSVTSIGSNAFYKCSGLTAVHITDVAAWCNLEFGDYYSNPLYYAQNLYLNGELVTELEIPSTVTEIKPYAFAGGSFKNVVMLSNVTSIGGSAFGDCNNLATVTFAENGQMKSIGSSAFYGCSSLTSIVIPSSVISIGSYAFDGSGLKSVTFAENSQMKSIGSSAFYGCSSLTSIVIPDSVTSIDGSAFQNCNNLATVTFGDNSQLKSISLFAFQNCNNLTNIDIPASVTSIGGAAFSGCNSLTAVHITDIAAWCNIEFGDYSSNPLCYAHKLYLNGKLVTELEIPSTVTKIKNYVFYNCSSLTSIEIPNSVTAIGDATFSDCNNLATVTFGENSQLKSIGRFAFYGCSSFTNITIPSSVTSIGSYAFSGCSNLTIHCEASSQPSGWDDEWNPSNCPVVWGCVAEE